MINTVNYIHLIELFIALFILLVFSFFTICHYFFKKLFENQKSPKELDFFYEEVFADSQDDFFAVRPVDYTLKDIAITGEDLF